MAEAVVGDDVLGDDPTVKELERRAAALFGHEAALFVPSGTMGNLIALKAHTRPSEAVIVDALSHHATHEALGHRWIANVELRVLSGKRGLLDPDEVTRAAHTNGTPRATLVSVENTHNFSGGSIVPIEALRALRGACDEQGMRLHLDGARIWNASIASRTELRAYGETAHSVMFCLSKGLGAPVGSLLTGTNDFVREAREVRKALGGGMRQAGVLAAAGLVALDEGPRHLPDDHENACALARGMETIPGARVDPGDFPTNIVFLRTEAGPESYPKIQAALAEEGVLAIALSDLGVRFVTHRDVSRDDVLRALSVLARVVPVLGRKKA
jgi:threonine aldolase